MIFKRPFFERSAVCVLSLYFIVFQYFMKSGWDSGGEAV